MDIMHPILTNNKYVSCDVVMSISVHIIKKANNILPPPMKADFNDMSATFAKYQLTVTLDVDSDDILI